VSIAWDTSCPGAANYHIIHGRGSQLPIAPGLLFTVGGSVCDIGTSSPFLWNGTPSPGGDPTRLVWWLVLADDDDTVEGPWGDDSAGNERIGTGGGGSSDQCGMTDKALGNVCGQ
jgi:hypothetical protein